MTLPSNIKTICRSIFVILSVMLIVLSPSDVLGQSRRNMSVNLSHRAASSDSSSIAINDSVALAALPDSIPVGSPLKGNAYVIEDAFSVDGDSIISVPVDTIEVRSIDRYDVWETREVAFSPDPTRAVWMSALFPGLGQVYNRRYWKLPIVVGAYLGLGYATSWNNGMLNDYTRAYRDIMDTDPSTKSYMDLFPPTVREEDLDKKWLTNVLQSRKNFYRRNRDLCVICMIGVYLVAMVDAYVDASLSHFDISPDLSMDVTPAVFIDGRNTRPSVGLMWAFTF